MIEKLRIILYADDTPATQISLDILNKIEDKISSSHIKYWHDVSITPSIGAVFGRFIGLKGIGGLVSFVENELYVNGC